VRLTEERSVRGGLMSQLAFQELSRKQQTADRHSKIYKDILYDKETW
jgi:hypothetical protein